MKRPLENSLWCDCETDDERVEFLRSGRAWDTGTIAPPLVDAMADLFERARNAEKEIVEGKEWHIVARARIAELEAALNQIDDACCRSELMGSGQEQPDPIPPDPIEIVGICRAALAGREGEKE